MIRHKHQHADGKDQKLHRDLQERIQHKTHAALCERPPREIALHLALIASEVGERQEKASQHPREQRVGIFQIHGKIDAVPFAFKAGEMHGVADGIVRRELGTRKARSR